MCLRFCIFVVQFSPHLSMEYQQQVFCRRIWAVLRCFRSTFFSTDTVGALEKKYRYHNADIFISQFLGGTRYFCKIFYTKKRSLHSYIFGSNCLNDLFLKYNTAISSSAAIERFIFTGKDILKPKRNDLLELDDLSQMVLFLKDNSK